MRIKSKLLYRDQDSHLTGIQELLFMAFLSSWFTLLVFLSLPSESLTDQQINALYEQDMRGEIHLTDYQIKYLQGMDANN